MEKIDKIFYINLDKRPNRKVHFLNESETHNMPFDKIERYEAIDGDTYQFSSEELDMFRNCDFLESPNRYKLMGNQLSHYNILKEMVNKQYEYIIVCQDDAIFKSNIIQYIDNIIENMPDDAEIINISLHRYAAGSEFIYWDFALEADDEKYISIENINEYVCRLNHRIINPCSLAYIITLNGAKNIIQYFQETGFIRATDHNFNKYLIYKNIFYGSRKVQVTSNMDFKSDIFIEDS